MGSDFYASVCRRARRPRRCNWCCEEIEAGEYYYYCSGIYDGDWSCWGMHLGCYGGFVDSDLGEFTLNDYYPRRELDAGSRLALSNLLRAQMPAGLRARLETDLALRVLAGPPAPYYLMER